MLKNQLLITLRNMMKNKLYLFINIFGMGISIACCMIGYFFYDFNISFDKNHEKASTIYRVGSVRQFQNELTAFGYAPIALGNAIKQNITDVSQVVRLNPEGGNFRVKDDLFSSDITYVDPAFFKLFTYEFVEGNGDIKSRNEICISDELATKFFGQEKALGKTLTQMLDSGKTKEYMVTGVFKKQPDNSSLYYQMFSHYDNTFEFDKTPNYNENSWRYRTTLFVEIKDPTRVASVQDQIKPFAVNNNKIREDFIIDHFLVESFEGMGVRDSYSDKNGVWTNRGFPLAAVVGIGLMGIFVLLIAIFNMTNTAVAISSRRLKEIGIRKVMGSTRKNLIIQFIGETTLICFISLIVGLVIGELFLLPAFNKLWPEFNIVTDYFGTNFMVFMIMTLLFTSLLAGGYPAFYISKFQPVSILKGTQKFGGTNMFTKVLLCLQFSISLAGIVCSFAFTDNAKFQRDFDMGFDRNGVIHTNVSGRAEFEVYRNTLSVNPEIIAITGTQNHLYRSGFNDPLKHEDKEIEADILDVSADYLPTMGLTLKEGRNFVLDSETDRKESVIITEGLARKFGMVQPIGKEIIWLDSVKYYVVGVVQNIYNNGLWEEMDPMMFRLANKDDVNHIVVKAPVDKLVSIDKFMEAKWKEVFPDKLYDGNFMNESMVEADTVNNNLVTMFVFLGVVALMLSTTGLFTLVSLNIIKRMKEIGVRKVLGASMGNITRVINTEFIVILLIACVGGGFLGWWMSAMLMDSIWDYYQEVTITSLIISATILFAASVLSIGYKIYKTTRLNPAHVLRDE